MVSETWKNISLCRAFFLPTVKLPFSFKKKYRCSRMKIYLKKRNPFPRENEKKKFSKKTFPPVILFIKVINLNILVIHSRNVTTATQFLDLRTFKWKIDVIEKFDFMFWYEIQFAMLSLKCHSQNAEKKETKVHDFIYWEFSSAEQLKRIFANVCSPTDPLFVWSSSRAATPSTSCYPHQRHTDISTPSGYTPAQ